MLERAYNRPNFKSLSPDHFLFDALLPALSREYAQSEAEVALEELVTWSPQEVCECTVGAGLVVAALLSTHSCSSVRW
jgi:hypothetical protein